MMNLNLIRLMLASSLYATDREILPLAKMLFKWAAESELNDFDYKFHIEQKADYIYDSSLIPSLFRSLLALSGKLKPKRIGELDEYLGHNHEVIVNKVYTKLMESFINQGKYADLWGIIHTSGITYELYFTERSIESLTSFLIYYPNNIIPTIKAVQNKQSPKKSSKRKPRSIIPNDVDKYTLWIPKLVESEKPEELKRFDGWNTEDLSEFYVYRLFNVSLALDGAEWGSTHRGQSLPDGRLSLPNSQNLCLYDVKSSKGPFKFTKSELDKFVRYAEEGKRRASSTYKEVQFFLVVANSFTENIEDRASELLARANLTLVCIKAKDLCNFTNAARAKTTNPSELQLINWGRLLSFGKPLIAEKKYSKIIDEWQKDLERQ